MSIADIRQANFVPASCLTALRMRNIKFPFAGAGIPQDDINRNGVPLWAELHFLHIPSEFTTSQPKHFPLHRTQKQAVDLLCEIGNHIIGI